MERLREATLAAGAIMLGITVLMALIHLCQWLNGQLPLRGLP